MELDQVLNGESTNDEPMGEPRQQEPVQEPAQAEPEQGDPAAAPAAPPAAAQDPENVPLAALEAVRKERKDWKEKALRLEGEMEAYRRQQAQQAQQHYEQQPIDPVQQVEMRAWDRHLNMSETIARQTHPDLDEKFEVFQAAAQKDPTLAQRVFNDPHPWGAMYREATKIQMLQEIGDNPASYREKLKAEIMAELGQTQAAAPAAAPAPAPAAQIPQSLATARSAASRSAPAWTGPSSLDSILGKR